MSNTIVELKDVYKTYDDGFTALKDISIKLNQGEFYTLLGPSGSGKTTILQAIAGFTEVTSGEVLFDGKRINDIPANQRQLNTVFQDYALFPNMNVFENVAFGLVVHNVKKSRNRTTGPRRLKNGPT